jgi:hypothetical protein
MKTKETYLTPDIELINLDNDISLQLDSDPNPQGEPNWSYNQFNNNPMNDQLA